MEAAIPAPQRVEVGKHQLSSSIAINNMKVPPAGGGGLALDGCPPGRRPYHIVMTAATGNYQVVLGWSVFSWVK